MGRGEVHIQVLEDLIVNVAILPKLIIDSMPSLSESQGLPWWRSG